MASKVGFELGFGRSGGGRRRQPETPLKILFIGNYAADTAQIELSKRRAQPLDVDVFDALFRRIRPTLSKFELILESVEDFHPDRLLQTSWFADSVGLWSRLTDSNTFAEAARELRGMLGSVAAAPIADEPGHAGPAAPEDPTFARLLDQQSTPVSRSGDAVNLRISEMLKEAVAPYIQADADPDQAPLLAVMENLLSARLREVLHDPAFQSLEASWRWLDETVRRVETSGVLQLSMLPVGRNELTADTAVMTGDLANSQLFEALIRRDVDTVGADPWTFVVVDYQFNSTNEDVKLLAYLAALASEAGGQLITGAMPELAGCTKIADLNAPESWHPEDQIGMGSWQALRHTGLARSVVAALPRVLTRYPYSARLNPIAAFNFEEHGAGESVCLWGNAAYGCAIAAAQAFVEHGWHMDVAAHALIEDLPTWQIDLDGFTTAQPTTEVSLGETAAAALIDRGFTPICHVNGTNTARIPGLHPASRS